MTSAKKIALVTGGTRGIGLAVSLAFAGLGFDVFAAYSADEESAEKAREQGINAVRADVSDEGAVKALFARTGTPDVLVNNAGVALFRQIQDTTAAEWDRLFAVNVRGAFLCAREAAKGMISRNSGLIVNISSVWGEEGGSCESAYSASKAALIGFTKALAKELGPSGIRVNCVSCGIVDTQMNARLTEAEKQAFLQDVPLGRQGTPEEVFNRPKSEKTRAFLRSSLEKEY